MQRSKAPVAVMILVRLSHECSGTDQRVLVATPHGILGLKYIG